ncbi:hypothetical protein [Sulfurimonas sp. NWX79]|uniref:hypothetical protein n=1 Tax=Sulfurimonas sp. NWX79 TaxID=2925412 RepID=UPI003204C06E
MSRIVVILMMISSVILFADDLDVLLDKYQSESELSKKTKDENGGHLIIFTRDDLERMQVETLKDVLKSIRFFRYLENRIGEPDLLNIDPVLYSSKSVRVYLNDNELVLPITGSGFLMFGNIDMDFIDHVEVYEGFPSFDFGIEPATIVVRLYSKVASRDSGTRIKFLGASHTSNKENIYTAGQSDELSFFAYANHSQNKQEKYSVEGNTIARDITMKHFYGSLSKANYKIELNALRMEHDGFLGLLPVEVPKSTNMQRDFVNASFASKFQDESLTLNISYIYADGEYEANYSTPVYGLFSTMQQEYDSDILTAILQKKIKLDVHTLSIGLQYRYKLFKFDEVKYDGVPSTQQQKYDHENIYSLFVEDSILLNTNSLLGISLMQQYYERNKAMKNESVTQWRLSYIYSTKSFVSKTFVARQEFIPEPFMTAEAHFGNPELNSEKYLAITQEFSYSKENTLSKFIFGYSKTKGFLVSDSSGVVQNSSKDLKAHYAAVGFSYFFRKKDKLELQVDYTHLDVPGSRDILNHYNYLARVINTYGKFDIFNEIIINSGFENLDTGYDYSAGVKYRATPNLHFGLKGENIFNQGLSRKYYYDLPTSNAQFEVPVVEQKFMISMEYLF